MQRHRNHLAVALLSLVTGTAFAQSHPAAQAIPYSQDFAALAHASTTYPAGWQGWTIADAPGAGFNTTGPTADRALVASSSASTTSGNVHNYNGKIGFLNGGELDLTLALAIDTTGKTAVQVQYDIMTIRNPHGGTNTRINEVTLQYRVGTSGAWTTLTGIEYQNNTTPQTGTGVTTPQNLQTRSITLPSVCDNQSVVQLRWASRQIGGGGARPSFAIDNVSVTATGLPSPSIIFAGTPAAFSTTIGTPSAAQQLTVAGTNLTGGVTIAAPTGFEVATSVGGPYMGSFNLSHSDGTLSATAVFVRLTGAAAGSFAGDVTAIGGGADSRAIAVSGTVALAAPSIIGATNITDSSFDVAWGAVTGATGYQVDVYTTMDTRVTVLTESFGGFTAGAGGPQNADSTDIATNLNAFTETAGWTGSRVYQAVGRAKMGTTSALGWIQTPALDLSAQGGVFTVEVDARAWDTTGEQLTIDVQLDGHTIQTLTLSRTTMQAYTVQGTGGTANSVLRFTARVANNNRFFLDNLRVSTGTLTRHEVLVNEPVAGTSLHVSRLKSSMAYFVVTRATDGTHTSASSPPYAVTTLDVDTPPTITVRSDAFTVTEGDMVRFLVTVSDAESHPVTLTMDLAGATLVETATPGVYRFVWSASGVGVTSVTFNATANGKSATPVVVSITVTENVTPPVDPVVPVITGIVIAATHVEVIFDVPGGLQAGVLYTLESAATPNAAPGDWSARQVGATTLDDDTGMFTEVLPEAATLFYRVKASVDDLVHL